MNKPTLEQLRGIKDDFIKLISVNFSLNKDGLLSRDSHPYDSKQRNNSPLGIGFDTLYESRGYKHFTYRQSPNEKRVKVYSHRLVFFLANGFLPKEVDHIDRDRTNNHPSNLRSADGGENQRNVSSRKGSSSKFLGVSWSKRESKWIAAIQVNGKSKTIGSFKDENNAAKAYNDEAVKRDNKFHNLNEIK
jgi:hypothetical protein